MIATDAPTTPPAAATLADLRLATARAADALAQRAIAATDEFRMLVHAIHDADRAESNAGVINPDPRPVMARHELQTLAIAIAQFEEAVQAFERTSAGQAVRAAQGGA